MDDEQREWEERSKAREDRRYRDRIAVAAMREMIAMSEPARLEREADAVARRSYLLADAMLAARDRAGEGE